MQKTIFTALLLSAVSVSPVSAAPDSFDGNTLNAYWEIWRQKSPGAGGELVRRTDDAAVVASDATTPDIIGFHNQKNDYEQWDIDFFDREITLTYTSIYVQDFDHQYMHTSSKGFHFEDTGDQLNDIVNVTLDSPFAPFGLVPELVTFDANNIYVDLNGSMCHIAGMASMPDCANSASPTGYDNQIKLIVEFAGQAAGGKTPESDRSRIDAFFNWAEQTYPQFFPTHTASIEVAGYYARHYPETGVYLGTKDDRVYVYGDVFGGLEDVGSLTEWLANLSL